MSNKNSPSVAIIGAGMSGIIMGIRLLRAGFKNFQIFERSNGVGGTWYQHRYPGLCCDIPSHVYSFSFAGNPHWSSVYPPQAELMQYFQSVAEKFGLMRHIRLATPVRSVTFNAADGHWRVLTEDDASHDFNFVVGAMGSLNTAQYPEIAGRDNFTGEAWHSAHWRDDVDLRGKRVAVIGSAASAIQIVPEVAKIAEKLFVFQRTPNWVVPRLNPGYSERQRRRFAHLPLSRRWHRWNIYKQSLLILKTTMGDPVATKTVRDYALGYMHEQIKDPALRAKLTPDYEPGCKRILVSSDFYQALADGKFELVTDRLQEITPNGIRTSDGAERQVDVIIYCTGYKVPHFEGPVEITGRNGVTLKETFSKHPEAYGAGVSVPGFPNFFMINGPNGMLGYSSAIMSAEMQTKYIIRVIRRTLRARLRWMEIKKDVTDRYNKQVQAILRTTNFAGNCTGPYHDSTGHVALFYPGSAYRMWRELRSIRMQDYLVDQGG